MTDLPAPSGAPRRLVILAEGNFGFHHGKTAVGVIRYGPDDVVAVIDSTQAGGNVSSILPGHDIPIVATLDEALARDPRPDTLLIGIAPTGGKLPDSWRATILAAIRAGLDVHSGLHTFLGDDPEFAAAAAAAGTADRRLPPAAGPDGDRRSGAATAPGKRVILTVGTDCAIGKMSVALELRAAARAAGRSAAFVPTGQTGMMIEGWGAAVDRLISDFAQGTVEWMVEEGERRGDWVIVEGQGSLDHPAYSSVTLALIHGATPQAMVLVHKAGQTEHDFDHLPGRLVPDRRPAAVHRAPRAGRRARRAVEGRRDRAQHLGDRVRGRRPGRDRPGRRRDRVCRSTIPSASAPGRCGRAIEAAVEALPWVEAADVTLDLRRRSSASRSATRSGSPAPTTTPATRSRRSSSSSATTAIPGLVGIGEGYPDRFYGETAATMAAVLPLLARGASASPSRRRPASPRAGDAMARGDRPPRRREVRARHRPPRPRRQGRRACRSTTCSACSAEIPPTDFTLGLDEPAVVAERAVRAAQFPALKIKVGGPADLATLEAVRGVYAGPIRVDANTGWQPDDALALLPELERLGVELIEQPFPARRLDSSRWLQERSTLPIVADESAVTIDDLDGLVGVVAGVNVKLAKCGGVGPAAGDAGPGAGARLPDVPRLHGGDVGRDRRVGGRRVARRLGRPRRQPAPRRRPVRGPGARRRLPLAARRRPGPGAHARRAA